MTLRQPALHPDASPSRLPFRLSPYGSETALTVTFRKHQHHAFLTATLLLGVAAIAVASWFNRGDPEPFHELRLTSVQALELDLLSRQTAISWLITHSRQEIRVVLVRHIHSDRVLRVTTDAASDVSPVFSPDGASLAFARRVPGERASTIIVVPSIGGPERIVGRTEHDLEPGFQIEQELDFDPTGTLIAASCTAVSGKATAICLLPVGGGSQRTVTSPPDGHFDWSARFSPDGKKLAFARWSSGTATADVHTLTFETKSVTRVTTEPQQIFGLSWTSDGREIIIGTFHGLQRVPEQGGKLRRFVNGLCTEPRVTGNRLVYCEQQFDRDIWSMEIAGKSRDHLTAHRKFIYSTRVEGKPHISPDGKRVVFAAFLQGEIWTANRDGSQQARITPAGFKAADSPRSVAGRETNSFRGFREQQLRISQLSTMMGVVFAVLLRTRQGIGNRLGHLMDGPCTSVQPGLVSGRSGECLPMVDRRSG